MKRGSGVLTAGMRGFLLTGGSKEELFTREAITLFTDFNERLNSNNADLEHLSDDADKDLDTELSQLKGRLKAPFREVKLNIKHTSFIHCDLKNPEDFLLSLFTELRESGVKKTRYLERILPVSITTSCRREDISKSLGVLLQPFIDEQAQFPSFCVVSKITNNDVVSKELLSEMTADILVGWTAVHDRADVTVLVNVFRGLCCLGAVKKYNEFSKYNVSKIVPETGT